MTDAKRIGGARDDLLDRLLMLSQALPAVPAEHWRLVQEAMREIEDLRAFKAAYENQLKRQKL